MIHVGEHNPTGGLGVARRAFLAFFVALLAVLSLAPQANAQVVADPPPTFSRNIVIFPERDFVVVDGTEYAGDTLRVSVLRNDDQGNPVTIGSATGVADANGFLEINHPGGVCWGESPNTPNVTPDILPGDVVKVEVINPDGTPTGEEGSRATTRNVTAEAVFINDAGNLQVNGTARLANGDRVPLADLEQRVINPDLVETAVGRRDIRATGDGAGLGTLSYDGATGNRWTAEYTLADFTAAEREEIKAVALEGQTRIMSWQGLDATAALERVGITIFEVDELGGPGFGGCAAGANYGVTDFGRDAINIANQNQNLTVTGSSFGASTVAVTLDDENNPQTQPVPGNVTQQPDPATGHQTWRATFNAADVQGLDDGMLTASGTYTIPDSLNPTLTRNIKGADRQILKDVVEPGSPSASPSGAASYPTWQSVKLSRPAGEDRLSEIYYTTNGSAPSLASRTFNENIQVTDDQTIRAKIVDRAGNEGAAASFAYNIQIEAGTNVEAPANVTPVDATESTATGISNPPRLPHEVVIFPERDFVVADGYEPFKRLNFKVVRDGHVISTASGTTDKLGFLEVNHPGGVCWNGQTPDILPGDEVFVTDAQGNGDSSRTMNIFATAAERVGGNQLVVHGTAEQNGAPIPDDRIEQRIVAPELKDMIGKRDIRAVPGTPGGDFYTSNFSYDAIDPINNPDGTKFTATYTFQNAPGFSATEIRDTAFAGQTRVLSWLATDNAANRLGITIFEAGELGGPGFGGCPNAATFGATGANHAAVNVKFDEDPNSVFEIHGVSDGADPNSLNVRLSDGQNPPITAQSVQVIQDPNAALPGSTRPNAQLWKATFSKAEVMNNLGQGTLTASATYKLPADLPADPVRNMPVSLEILKDTNAPLAGGLTATPNGGTYPIWQAITLEHADAEGTEVHFTLNGSPATPNSRVAGSQIVLDARPAPYALKAIAVDLAGNRSAERTFNYTITDGIAPGQPGALDLTTASDTGVSNTDNITNDATPTLSGTAEARSTVRLFELTGTGALNQVGSTTAGNDGSFSVTASTLSDGAHALLVTATDASGNQSARSAVLNVTVDTAAPNTTINSGPTDRVNVTTASFGFSSSEPQGARFQCSLDGAAFAACTSPRNFTGLAPNRAHTFSVRTTDVAGNAEAVAASRTWTIDTVRPTVTRTTPAAGARNVGPASNVTATFSEAMTAGSIDGTSVRLVRASNGQRVGATVSYNAATRVVTLNPANNLVRGATYTATVVGGAAGVEDLAGNTMASGRNWSFRIIP